MNKEIDVGQIILMIKNEDNSFSPVGLSKAQAFIAFSFLAKLSEDEPLIKSNEKYIKKE